MISGARKTKQTAEFGDFQTSPELAREICAVISRRGFRPRSVVEPTCGLGNLLLAALDVFPSVSEAVGLDISPDYVRAAKQRLGARRDKAKARILQGNFFETDWDALLADLPGPTLVVGNPPWVTNAHLSALNSSNVPEKTNFQNLNGFDAMTGKSNFDISEWMLIRVLNWLDRRAAVMAMLCKTAVARKLLMYAWKNDISLSSSAIYHIDAARHFDASVDSCLFVCTFSPSARTSTSAVYGGLDHTEPAKNIGVVDGEVVASLELFERWKHLRGDGGGRWRSGVKHDCAKVMELTKEGGRYRNGLGELVELEDDYVYPMLKSSDVANGPKVVPRRWMLVTQKTVREDTSRIKESAPKTWRYLLSHAGLLDKRGSSIYKNRPRFSVFGVGDYSFSRWKVATSGFYKKLCFKVVGPHSGKPVMLDDTSYFVPCKTKAEAERIASLLNSRVAREFFEAYIFWDAKRPVTMEILRRLDISALEAEVDEAVGG